jgi:hypothetical protein
MADRQRWWRIGFGISLVVNVGGGIIALVQGEMMHAAGHAVLLAATLAFWPKVSPRRTADDPVETAVPQLDTHLDHLQQSVDAIALEVERIGEAQRFAARVIKEQQARNESSK